MEVDGKDRPTMIAPGTTFIGNLESEDTLTQNQTSKGDLCNCFRRYKEEDGAEAKAFHIIFIGIDNDIYSRVDACPNAKEMWKENKCLKQDHEIVSDEEEAPRDKEIQKLMALISTSFNKIYKPTNNNLRTSSNTRNKNVENNPRSDRRIGYDRQTRKYENQRAVNVVRNKENVRTQVDQDGAHEEERALPALLIENTKLDIDESKKINKEPKKANTSLYSELTRNKESNYVK
nr:hypothetical protein [Tanacetum cinerariifolium]